MAGRIYDTQRWKRVRRLHLQKEPLCRHCRLQGKIVQACEVDHRQSIESGGDPWSDDNLQSLCTPCHSRKTAGDEGKVVRHGCDAKGNPIDPRHPWNAPKRSDGGVGG